MTNRPTPAPRAAARPTPAPARPTPAAGTTARPTPALRPTPRVVSAHTTPYLVTIQEPVRRRRRAVVLPAIALLLLVATAAGTIEPTPPRTLPDAVLGTWRSDAATHAGRRLVLTRDMIAIGTGQGRLVPHAVTGVVTRQRDDSTTLAITYREDDATESELHLAWATGSPGTLVVGGVRGHWVRKR